MCVSYLLFYTLELNKKRKCYVEKSWSRFIKPGFQTHIHTFDFKLMVPDFFGIVSL